MSRRCMVTGKSQLMGNNVSHAENRTRRAFRVNVKDQGFFSEALGRSVRMRVSVNGIRSIEHKGGLDAWLVNTAPSKLPAEMRPIKAQVEKKLAASGKKPVKKAAAKKPVKKNISARLAKKVAAKKK